MAKASLTTEISRLSSNIVAAIGLNVVD
jgi:hypothetical protein